jgi:hypothetical protein
MISLPLALLLEAPALQRDDQWRIYLLDRSTSPLPKAVFRKAKACLSDLEDIVRRGDARRFVSHLTSRAELETWDSNPPEAGVRRLHPIDVVVVNLTQPIPSNEPERVALGRFLAEIKNAYFTEAVPTRVPHVFRLMGKICSNYYWAADVRFAPAGYHISRLILLEHGNAIERAEQGLTRPTYSSR